MSKKFYKIISGVLLHPCVKQSTNHSVKNPRSRDPLNCGVTLHISRDTPMVYTVFNLGWEFVRRDNERKNNHKFVDMVGWVKRTNNSARLRVISVANFSEAKPKK